MPRSPSSLATTSMNGWNIPAPAPCARTKQARAFGGTRSSPETLCALSTVMVRTRHLTGSSCAPTSLSVESGASFAYICEGRASRSTLACAECHVSLLWSQDGTMSAKDFEILRQHMLVEISAGTFHVRDVIGKTALDERVMAAMAKVPRHEFVPVELQPYAYVNIPLPIGFEKTISQPFIVALMTDLLDISAEDTVLEIGTGLGYQAAILAQLARKVQHRNHRRARPTGEATPAPAGLHQYRAQDRQRLSRLVRARSVRQGDRDGGSRSHSPAADPSVEGWRENGHSCRPARRPAARPGREKRQRQGDDEGDSTGEVLAARGDRTGHHLQLTLPERERHDARIYRRHKRRWQTRERDGGGGGRADRCPQGEVRAAGCPDQLRAAAQQARRSASSPRLDCRQGQVIGRVIARRALDDGR